MVFTIQDRLNNLKSVFLLQLITKQYQIAGITGLVATRRCGRCYQYGILDRLNNLKSVSLSQFINKLHTK